MAKYRGGDYPINKTLTSDGTTPIAPSSLDNIIIYLITKYQRQIVQQWQLPLTAGYDPVTVVNDAAGQIRFFVQSADLAAGLTGQYQLEYLLRSTDANYDDNEYDRIQVEDWDIVLDTVIKAE